MIDCFESGKNMHVLPVRLLLILSIITTISASRIIETTSPNIELEGLELVNKLREIHQVPELRLNAELTKSAVKWCNRILKKAKKDHLLKPWFAHPKSEGEAVFVGTGNVTATTAVMNWYCEAVSHNFTNPSFQPKTAQFSQLVWNETKSMGITKLVDEGNGNVAIVARFFPPGNFGYESSFQRNVFEPTSWDIMANCIKAEHANIFSGLETTMELLPAADQRGRTVHDFLTTTVTSTERLKTTTPSLSRPEPVGKVVLELKDDDDR